MSSSVKINIPALESAIKALTGLAGRIETQRTLVLNGTPCSVPSLSSNDMPQVVAWLKDQEPELSTRLDLAKLLDTTGAGVATYTTDADTLANVQRALGHELATRVNDVSYDTDPEKLKELNEILSSRSTDMMVMTAMYNEVTPQNLAHTMSMLAENMNLGSGGEDAMNLAKTLRAGLATASKNTLFDGTTYGREMVRWMTAPLLSDDEQQWAEEHDMMGMNGASTLAFMMRDVDYGKDFLGSAAQTLTDFEKNMQDGDFGPATYWYGHNGYSPFNEDAYGGNYADPMSEMMRAMSRQPEVGYDFLQHEGNADFVFDKRDWSNDGYDGVAALADKVSTDPGIYQSHPREAAMIASQFVDWTANSEGFNPDDAKAASDSVGHLLKAYMPSMAAALDGDATDGDPAILAAGINLPGYGELDNMPKFYRGDLASMTGVAMSTEGGMTEMASGVADYRQTQINALANQLADDPKNIDTRTSLQSVMMDDAELRAFTTKIAGQTQIDDAHNTDQQRQFWTNLVAEGAKQIPIKPPIVGTIVDHGITLGADAVNDAWANTADGVEDEWEANATNGISEMNYESYASLVNAGVIPQSEVPDGFMHNGEMQGYNDIPADQRSDFAARAAEEMRNYMPDESLENTYRSRFEDFYNDPTGNGE